MSKSTGRKEIRLFPEDAADIRMVAGATNGREALQAFISPL